MPPKIKWFMHGSDIVITWDKNRQNSMVIPQVTLRLRSGYSQNMLRLVSGYFLARHRLLSVYSHANSTANLFTVPFFTIYFFHFWHHFLKFHCFLCQFCCRRRRRRRFGPFIVLTCKHFFSPWGWFVKNNFLNGKTAADADTDADL